jgi:hypothetical protein
MRDDPGVELAHYRDHHPAAGVSFYCCACHAHHDVPVARVIERLKARGIGGERTGVREVGRLADQPCAKCGAVAWETRPSFPMR